MKIELKVDGKVIRKVDIPVENPDYNYNNIALGNDFEGWIKNWFGVEE